MPNRYVATVSHSGRNSKSAENMFYPDGSIVFSREPHPPTAEIVKVQVGTSSDGDQIALVYNEDRSKLGETEAQLGLLRTMGGRPKKFFYAAFRKGELTLYEAAPWQDW